MITDIQFLEASNSIELDYISLYANTFLNIKSDYIYDNLHFSITFKNNQNNKSYTINSYAEANVNEVSIYLKKILQIIQSQYYELNSHYFTINILIKEYHNNEYIDEVLIENKNVYFYNSYIYNNETTFYPNYNEYYFFYNTSTDYDIITKRNCKWYLGNGKEIQNDDLTIDVSSIDNKIIIIKDLSDNILNKIKIFYINSYDKLNSLEFLNINTGIMERFSGWKIIDEKFDISKNIYKSNNFDNFWHVQSHIEKKDTIISISNNKIPIKTANYIYKNIILSPYIKFNDKNCVILNDIFDDISMEDDYDFGEMNLQLQIND